MDVELQPIGSLRGEVTPPPDKSVSHRAVMFSALSSGKSVVTNFLRAEDTMSTVGVFRSMGVEVEDKGDELVIEGRGLWGLREPVRPLDCGNSGTTMRLMSGVLSGSAFFSVMTGDDSLSSRPMGRVLSPMRQMGATIMARKAMRGDKLVEMAPIAIQGGGLKSIKYTMPVASAQVKSAVLLAGLYADGTTEVVEKVRSRDHTERMLPAYGASLRTEGLITRITGGAELRGRHVEVPNDFSSAAFFIAAALMVPGSMLVINNVGVNPTRKGFLDVVRRMGGDVQVENEREVSGEPVADIVIRHSSLSAVEIDEQDIPSMIDEFPVFCVLASQAEGTTIIRGAEELRVKESDRIATVAAGLRSMGVSVEEFPDGMSVEGPVRLGGTEIDSFGDHRIAMAFSVAALVAEGVTKIRNAGAVNISFPGFFEVLKKVSRG